MIPPIAKPKKRKTCLLFYLFFLSCSCIPGLLAKPRCVMLSFVRRSLFLFCLFLFVCLCCLLLLILDGVREDCWISFSFFSTSLSSIMSFLCLHVSTSVCFVYVIYLLFMLCLLLWLLFVLCYYALIWLSAGPELQRVLLLSIFISHIYLSYLFPGRMFFVGICWVFLLCFFLSSSLFP